MDHKLGEFEEMVLLAVAILYRDAYGLSVMEEIERQSDRSIMLSSVHKVLMRLEQKGFLKSQLGGATEERGGRSKRLYSITASGKEALKESQEIRNRMWHAIPDVVWNISLS
ncbi:MAG: PadR family transcriptional regulator [Cyclobacteriaceae bacterium]